MKSLAFISLGLLLCFPTQAPAQEAPSQTAPVATAATVSDFLSFVRAIRPLKEGQLTSELLMDLTGDKLKLNVRGQLKQRFTATGKFTSEVTLTPPNGAAPKHYRVYGDAKTTTIHDTDAKVYATVPTVSDDDFFYRGLLTKMAQESLAKMPPEILSALDAKTLPTAFSAVLKDKLSGDAAGMTVRLEQVEGKRFKVFAIPSGDKKDTGPVEIFVDERTGKADRLQIKLKQDQLDVVIQERVVSSSPAVPAGTRFRFTPKRGTKKVKTIDVGGFG